MAIGLQGRIRAGTGWRGAGSIYLALTSAGASLPTRSTEADSNGFDREAITLSPSASTGVVTQQGSVTFTATGSQTVSGFMITTGASQESSDQALQDNLLAYGSLTSRTLNSGDTLTFSSYTLTPQT